MVNEKRRGGYLHALRTLTLYDGVQKSCTLERCILSFFLFRLGTGTTPSSRLVNIETTLRRWRAYISNMWKLCVEMRP